MPLNYNEFPHRQDSNPQLFISSEVTNIYAIYPFNLEVQSKTAILPRCNCFLRYLKFFLFPSFHMMIILVHESMYTIFTNLASDFPNKLEPADESHWSEHERYSRKHVQTSANRFSRLRFLDARNDRQKTQPDLTEPNKT